MQAGTNARSDRCTVDDYRRLFASNPDRLQWLCQTLTCDKHRARLSFDHALDQSLDSASLVFREWMLTWAQRLIIKSCITTMHSDIQKAAGSVSAFPANRSLSDSRVSEQLLQMASEFLQEKLLALDVFSRFVVVLRFLKHYSRRETALLLNVNEMLCAAAEFPAAAWVLSLPDANKGLRIEEKAMTTGLGNIYGAY
jgi:DNA-directed RNA polymerase specialized sigma24 family protein